MKRSELKRKTPLRSTSTLNAKAPMARGTKPYGTKPNRKSGKRAERNAGPDYLGMCRGQRCYLLLPGIHCAPIDTVVPCHSNQAKHGKGMGIKALDIYTVPGCCNCHRELDQGMRFTREEKFAFWDAAYKHWSNDRKIQFQS